MTTTHNKNVQAQDVQTFGSKTLFAAPMIIMVPAETARKGASKVALPLAEMDAAAGPPSQEWLNDASWDEHAKK